MHAHLAQNGTTEEMVSLLKFRFFWILCEKCAKEKQKNEKEKSWMRLKSANCNGKKKLMKIVFVMMGIYSSTVAHLFFKAHLHGSRQ